MEPETQDRGTTGRASKSPRRRAILISVAFHIVLAAALLFYYLPSPTTSVGSPAPLASTSDRSSEQAAPSTDRPPPPAPIDAVDEQQIRQSVESQIEQFESIPEERKLSELEKNLQRLEAVSDRESVNEVAATIAGSLGIDAGQYSAKTVPADGAFDHESAQLQDVTRKADKDGSWRYESTMVDSQGRTMTVPMNAAEAETVYATFQQMKKYPLAEGIYRGVVMPLLQKMMEADRAARQTAIETLPPEQEVADADESDSSTPPDQRSP